MVRSFSAGSSAMAWLGEALSAEQQDNAMPFVPRCRSGLRMMLEGRRKVSACDTWMVLQVVRYWLRFNGHGPAFRVSSGTRVALSGRPRSNSFRTRVLS